MKKRILFLSCYALLFFVVSCGNNQPKDADNMNNTNNSEIFDEDYSNTNHEDEDVEWIKDANEFVSILNAMTDFIIEASMDNILDDEEAEKIKGYNIKMECLSQKYSEDYLLESKFIGHMEENGSEIMSRYEQALENLLLSKISGIEKIIITDDIAEDLN